MTGLLLLLMMAQAPTSALNESLWEAARAGDAARVASLVDEGADVNAKARYDMTALHFAADKGRLEVVRLLVARGANVNAQDTFYRTRSLDWALSNGHRTVATFLLEQGSEGADNALEAGVEVDDLTLVRAALAARVSRQGLETALVAAERQKRTALLPMIKAALDARPAEPPPEVTLAPSVLASYAGTYRNETQGTTAVVSVREGDLEVAVASQPPARLAPTSTTTFRGATTPNLTVSFDGRGGLVEAMSVTQAGNVVSFAPVRSTDTVATSTSPTPSSPLGTRSTPPSAATATRSTARDWPSFRGDAASGNGDGQGAVTEWDVVSGRNIKWKTTIPGIANSSPIVIDNRIFVTTAVGASGDRTFRTGLYGDVASVADLSDHEWKIYCLDKATDHPIVSG